MSEQEKQLETNELTQENAVEAPKAEEPQKTDKAAKPAKKKKEGNRIARWFREMKSELKKVQWPGWKQTWNNTLTVIVCVILIGIFIWAFDWVAHNLVLALLRLAGKG